MCAVYSSFITLVKIMIADANMVNFNQNMY